MKQRKTISVWVLTGLGFILIIFALLAGLLGFDPNNGWGPKRVYILTAGFMVIAMGLFFGMYLKNESSIKKRHGGLSRILIIPVAYLIISIAFLSPLASDRLVPGEWDFRYHISNIVQARKALEEGQFPIRIAPDMNLGYRYPLFQFYSPLPYTVAGFMFKYYTPDNAFLVYRVMVLLAMIISGVYIFRISYHFTKSIRASFLSGIIYITAPYFIINIHARSAWTEVIAQGILPVVLFYTLKIHSTQKQKYFLAASFSWFVLFTTHLITFVYSVLFIGLFILLISFPLRIKYRSLILALMPILVACLLGCTYLGPILTTPVQIKSFSSPFPANWLTSLFTLLSPISIAPEPQPGSLSESSPGLHTAIGWPILLAVAYVLYLIVSRNKNWIRSHEKNIPLALCGIFVLAFFVTWSPFDFWKYLPSSLYITQVTYRFATHTMWSGAILSALAIAHLFSGKTISDLHIIIGIILIALCDASWLNIQNLPPITVVSAMNSQLYQSDYRYQITKDELPDQPFYNVKNDCRQVHTVTVCDISLKSQKAELIQFPVYYYPKMLDIKINGKNADYPPTFPRDGDDILLGLWMESGTYHIEIQFTGLESANGTSIIAWSFFILWVLFLSIRKGMKVITRSGKLRLSGGKKK